jgi:ATP-dependent Clp protease ATP-binding subunit ClpC
VAERFTQRAQHAVTLAQEEAQALKHYYIGTEHLLLGLLREEEGLAARVLESLDVGVERARSLVARMITDEAASGEIRFTPRAEKALEQAWREALSRRQPKAPVPAGDDSGAADALGVLGVGAEKIRSETVRMVPSPRTLAAE